MSPQVDRPAHIQTLISSVDRYNPGSELSLSSSSSLVLLISPRRSGLTQALARRLPLARGLLAAAAVDWHLRSPRQPRPPQALVRPRSLLLLLLLLLCTRADPLRKPARSQFNPAILSPSASLSALFLALSNAPFAPDFNLSLSLLSDSFAVGAALPPLPAPHPDSDDSDDDDDAPAPANGGPREPKGEYEAVQRLKQLSALLAARKFRAFWSLVSAPPTEGEDKVREVNALVEGLKESAQGWAERVRKEIAGEVERCFRSLKREQLAAFLGTDGASPLLSLSSLSSLSSPPCPARSRPAVLTRASSHVRPQTSTRRSRRRAGSSTAPRCASRPTRATRPRPR